MAVNKYIILNQINNLTLQRAILIPGTLYMSGLLIVSSTHSVIILQCNMKLKFEIQYVELHEDKDRQRKV